MSIARNRIAALLTVLILSTLTVSWPRAQEPAEHPLDRDPIREQARDPNVPSPGEVKQAALAFRPTPQEARRPEAEFKPFNPYRLKPPEPGGRISLVPPERNAIHGSHGVPLSAKTGSLKSGTSFINWKKINDPQLRNRYTASERIDTGTKPRALTFDDFQRLLNSGNTIVNSGEVPRGEGWRRITDQYPAQFVTHEADSANREPGSIAEAAALADRPLDPSSVKVFNALPQLSDGPFGQQERVRMGIGGAPQGWRAVNAGIQAASQGLNSQVATRQALLDELQHGSASVIIVYAHFDGFQLRMPGVSGASVSILDLARINRRGDPAVRNRVIILAACSTAEKTAGAQSLTSVLLRNGIARTVLATDRPYDGRDIPDLLARLRSRTPVRQAGGQLRQYVELRQLIPTPLLRRRVTTLTQEPAFGE